MSRFDDVEFVEAEVVSDGTKESSNEYWREALKEELRAELRADYRYELRKGSLQYASKFYSFGSILAIVISYTTNYSVFWAIIHGLLGWFYVLYHVIFG
ncbi:MAG TPA: CAAX protease family protein [Firmicutes bacterium]|nr:CAAX protease family protein [Bacillota bacterium]